MTLKGYEYLKTKRQLNDETIEKFQLGYCDHQGFIYVPSSFPDVQLNLDKRFNDSVMFPIFDLHNEIIGISARTLNNADLKYVNTVYPKTEHLYGLSVTWKDCLKENKVYVVEGNIDVLRLYQSGIKNVVGMLGSVLKERQLTLLSRFVENVIVVPDGDKAGRKILTRIENNNSFREKLNINISVLSLPKDYDPDTYLLKHSIEEFRGLEKTNTSSLQEKLKSI